MKHTEYESGTRTLQQVIIEYNIGDYKVESLNLCPDVVEITMGATANAAGDNWRKYETLETISIMGRIKAAEEKKEPENYTVKMICENCGDRGEYT